MKDVAAFIKENKSRLLPLGILAFLALATFFTLDLTRQRQVRPKAAVQDAVLTFNPTTQQVNPGDTFTVDVFLNTPTQPVVGSDILVQFMTSQLQLTGIAQSTNPPSVLTYAPVVNDNSGTFDTARVVNCANNGGLPNVCPSGPGVVEFGFVTFDWANSTVTSPINGVFGPVATLTFQVRQGATGSSSISFVYDALNPTIDSNVVHNPPTGDPEDIWQVPPTSTVTVTVLEPTPPPGSSPSPTPSPSPSPTPSPSPSPTPSPSASPTPTPPGTSPSPSPSGGQSMLYFWINYQYVRAGQFFQNVDRPVYVSIRQGTQVFLDWTTVNVSVWAINAQTQSVTYRNTNDPLNVFGIPPGTYDVYINGPQTLSKRFTGVNLPPTGDVNFTDFSAPGTGLVLGDAIETASEITNRQDRIDIFDYAFYVRDFGTPPQGSPVDVDFDGDVDIFDYTLWVLNYNQTGEL